MKFRALDESLIEMGYDLIDKGIIYDKSKKKSKRQKEGGHFFDSKLEQKNVKLSNIKSVLGLVENEIDVEQEKAELENR